MNFLVKAYAFLGKLGGKRFIIGLGTLLGIALQGTLGLDPAQVEHYAGWAAALMFGDQLVNWLTGNATSAQKVAENLAPKD